MMCNLGGELSGANALVTGAAGFIGANLCRRLIDLGLRVGAVVRPSSDSSRLREIRDQLEILELDLVRAKEVADAIRRSRPDVVFHAAMGSDNPSATGLSAGIGNSVLATAQLLDALATICGTSTRLVHLSSFLVYRAQTSPHRETEPMRPETVRGALKAATEMLVVQQARSQRVSAVVLRLFSAYGPLQHTWRLVARVIDGALRNRELPMTAARSRRDFVFVDDVVDACLCAALHGDGSGMRFNVGSGVESSPVEVVRAVNELTECQILISHDAYPRRPADRPHCSADCQRAERDLGWRARTTLREGLASTIAWQRARLGGERQ